MFRSFRLKKAERIKFNSGRRPVRHVNVIASFSPGIEGLGKAFVAFYDKFLDKSAPGSELGEAKEYFDSLTAEE